MERKLSRTSPARRPSQRGFTLVEIMVVVVILGLLATLVVPNVLGASDEANLKKAKVDVAALKGTVDMYLLRSGSRELPTWDILITPDQWESGQWGSSPDDDTEDADEDAA